MRHFQLLLLLSGVLWGQANPVAPALPGSVSPSTRPAATGSTVAVHQGDNLQSKYNAAVCGQDLVLDDGATFTGNFIFNKQCTAPNWILIEGTGCANGTVAVPTYVTAANINSASVPPIAAPSLTHYATLTASTGSTLVTTDGSNVPGKYNYFGCLEVTAGATVANLIQTTNSLAETVVSQLGDHIMFDRIYAHGIAGSQTQQITRAFLVAGSNIAIVNSYVSQIYVSGADSQAIEGVDGPGPYLIHNNFLSAATENIMFGGVGATPHYSCTVASSPSPSTTSATVSGCLDGNSGAVSTPAIGTCVMFKTSSGSPAYLPTDWTCITGNTGGALTFPAIHAAPLAGAAKVVWGIVPSDITVTQNFIYKLPSWNSSDPSYDGVTGRSIKDLLEVKYGRRWLINGNVLMNTWAADQQYAFNINSNDQNGDCPWCTSSDVTLTNNIVKNIAGDFQIITSQNSTSGLCPGQLARVLIQNNLFWPLGAAANIASGGRVFELAANYCAPGVSPGTDSLQIIHNLMLGDGVNMILSANTPYNFTNLVIKDNITEFDQYRWTAPTPCADGTPAFQDGIACMKGDISTGLLYTVSNNAIVNSGAINGGQGQPDSVITSRYGAMILPILVDTTRGMNYAGAGLVNYSASNADYHNLALTAASPFHGRASDGTDPGVNFGLLDSVIGTRSPGTNVTGNGSVKGSVKVQ